MAKRAKAGSKIVAKKKTVGKRSRSGSKSRATQVVAPTARKAEVPKWPWFAAQRIAWVEEEFRLLVFDLALRLFGGPVSVQPNDGFRDGSPVGVAAWMRNQWEGTTSAGTGVAVAVRVWVRLARIARVVFARLEMVADSESEKAIAKQACAAFDSALRVRGLACIVRALEFLHARQPGLGLLPNVELDEPHHALARIAQWLEVAPEVDERLRSEELNELFEFIAPLDAVLPVLFADFSGFKDKHKEKFTFDPWQRAFVETLHASDGSPMKTGDVMKSVKQRMRSNPRAVIEANKVWKIGRNDRKPHAAIGTLIERTRPSNKNGASLWRLMPYRMESAPKLGQ